MCVHICCCCYKQSSTFTYSLLFILYTNAVLRAWWSWNAGRRGLFGFPRFVRLLLDDSYTIHAQY